MWAFFAHLPIVVCFHNTGNAPASSLRGQLLASLYLSPWMTRSDIGVVSWPMWRKNL